MRKRSLIAFWPQYFDRDRPRSKGRKVAKKNATPEPKAQDVLKGAQSAGYYAEMDPFRQYPRTWWDEPGMVLVDTMGQKKTFALHKIAPEVKKAAKTRISKSKEKGKKRKENIQKLKAKAALKKRLQEKKYSKGKK